MKPTLRAALADIPSLRPVLERARKKYVSLSKVGGQVMLDPTEARDLRRVGCRVSARGALSLVELDRALRESGLEMSLLDALEASGGSVVTRVDRVSALDASEIALLAALRAEAVSAEGQERLERWIEADTQYLRNEVAGKSQTMRAAATRVARALDRLPGKSRPEMLASFSAVLSGSAHTFDSTELGGRLLLRALYCISEGRTDVTLAAEERELLLAEAGILIDDVSSDVLVAGITATSETFRAAVADGLPLRLPLYTVDRVAGFMPANGGIVFAVENPPVFRILVERFATSPLEHRPALICTSGHLSLAAQRLVAKLVQNQVEIRYSGDLDLQGIEIALSLESRYPGSVHLWRMSPEDHRLACSRGEAGPPLDEVSAARLARRSEIHALMLTQATVHQETFADVLGDDIEAALANV